MKKTSLFIPAVLWCCIQCAPVAAQSLLSEQYPGGLPIGNSTGPSRGIGGSGVGVQNDFFGMADNPGNLGGIKQSVFSTYLSMDYQSINDNSASSGSLAFSPRLFSFAFPLGALGTFGFSIDRRSDMTYKYLTSSTVTYPENGYTAVDTIDLGIAKIGGTTVWQAGWGYAFGHFLKAGVSYERMYLSGRDITMMQTAVDQREGAWGQSTYDTEAIVFRGNAIRGGALFPFKKLTIGCSGEYVFSGTLEKTTFGMHYIDSQVIYEQSGFHLPPSFSAGASYQFSPQWLTAGSFGMTLWRNYYSGITISLPVDNAYTFSLGGQYIPAPNLLVPRYWEIMQYRAGIRYEQLPVSTASEMALTLSLGLPVQQGGGLFDVVLDIGRRYDSNIKNYSENFVSIGLGINGGRKWFQNTGIRY